MAEETTTSETSKENEEASKSTETTSTTSELTAEEQKVVDAADSPEAVRSLIQNEREARKAADKAAEEAKAKAKELENAQKSDQQKLSDERDELKSTATDATKEALRLRVAIDKKLPAELVDRLRGETKEELEKDADDLRKLLNEGGSETVDFEGGAAGKTSTSDEKTPDSMIRQMAGRR
jgi:hypothetical protein